MPFVIRRQELKASRAAVAPDSRSRPKAEPRARPKRCVARRSAGSTAAGLAPWGGREVGMKGPRPARMPVYGAGSKCLGRTEKETEWLRFHAPQPPGNFHCARTAGVFSFFCELKVKNGTIDGYIKPLFRHMKVYEARKDAEKSLFHKLYEKLIRSEEHTSE